MGKFLALTVVYFIEMLISFAFFNKNYERRFNIPLTLVLGAVIFAPCLLLFELFNNEAVNTLDYCIFNLIFTLSCFKIRLKSAVVQSALLDLLMLLTEYIVTLVLSYMFEIPADSYRTELNIFILFACIAKLLYFVVAQALSLVIKRGNNNLPSPKQLFPLFVFPAVIMVTLLIFLYLANYISNSKPIMIATVLISLLGTFACIFVFIYYQTVSEKEARLNELEAEQRFYKVNDAYLNVLEHQNDELQMLFHDTKHHYHMLSNLDTVEEVRDYINKIYPDIESKNTFRITKNKTLDLILNKYIILCRQNEVDFSYEVKTSDLSFIENSDLSIILNNVLDNAFEAALKSKDKTIELSIRYINNMDMLSVVNSCDTPPLHRGKKLLTSKSDSSSHGFGTKIIEKYTDINNGRYEWFYDEKEHRFHLSILFRQSE